MPVDDEDVDDSFHEAPPRLSMALDDADAEDATIHSVEGGRRALSEDPRLSRASFGRMRLSERFGDLVDIDEDGVELFDDEDIAPPILFDDADDALGDDTVNRFEDDTTQELRALLEARRQSRVSDINGGAGEVDSDNEPTFRFVMPTGRTQRPSMPAEDAGAGDEPEAFDQQSDPPSLIEDDRNAYGPQPDDEDEEEAATPRPLRQDSTEATQDAAVTSKQPGAKRKPKDLRLSRFGIKVPELPSSSVKRYATSCSRRSGGAKFSKAAIEDLMAASEWFFEQVAEDLGSYADHAGRKTIDESDVVTLMHRQRQINATTTPFSLAQRNLPRELLQEIRMPPAPKSRSRKRNRLAAIEEDEEE
ncbi:hypothetical protein K490DRAFT_54728 [Saccharata proteae CBS 121410]|uniref:CENP-T/Histone H4 histone fold domain-containing protein n=1 Tax=Saccharata proteae CBS 121410 TaxID=1314787 RepID=A0A9P4HZJ5_9PEZI|nr:hypothetical protein K490DRAFT_54728 [Saccharata proteae CBS 121410]